MHFANMFVMRAKHMEAYCSWLFSILFEIEKHMDLTGYDDYNRRVYGFLAERLLTVWVLQQQLDYTEAPVALVAEKADIRAAGEMLRAYIEQKDMQAAGTYYQTLHEEHPDFFYAGAGVGEEFVVACLVVEIHQLESRVGESHFIRNRSFEEMQTLLTRFRDLLKQGGSAAGAVYTLVKTEELSPVFVAFMVSQFVTDATDKLYIYSGLAEGYAAANDGQTAMYYAKLAMQGK